MGLELDGSLEIRGADGTAVCIRGTGAVVEIDVDGREAGFSTGLSRARRALPFVRLTAVALERAGVTATVRIGRRRVMTVGRNVAVNAGARVLRIPHARLG
ncbi:MAG: hypothetical protein NVSMB64_24210 [Candidatus Velthaea sp.]